MNLKRFDFLYFVSRVDFSTRRKSSDAITDVSDTEGIRFEIFPGKSNLIVCIIECFEVESCGGWERSDDSD